MTATASAKFKSPCYYKGFFLTYAFIPHKILDKDCGKFTELLIRIAENKLTDTIKIDNCEIRFFVNFILNKFLTYFLLALLHKPATKGLFNRII